MSSSGPKITVIPAQARAAIKNAKADKLERKIVQIAQADGWLISLCNDGTVWKFFYDRDGWEKLPPIPQGDVP